MRELPRLRLLRKEIRLLASGTSDDLEIGPVPPGEQWYVERVAAVNESAAMTRRGVAVKSAGALFWIDEQAFTTQSQHESHQVRTYLNPGESLIVRITGAAATNVLRAFATGHYIEFAER